MPLATSHFAYQRAQWMLKLSHPSATVVHVLAKKKRYRISLKTEILPKFIALMAAAGVYWYLVSTIQRCDRLQAVSAFLTIVTTDTKAQFF